MEAVNNCRKRARDDDDELEAADNTEILQANKKQECSNNYDERRYEFHDGIGVFDFPWLKEGVVFNSSEPSFEEEKFPAPCSYLDEDAAAETHVAVDSCSSINLSVSPAKKDDDEESLWSSLAVDDLEPLEYCIWSCVIDHPLDVGFNKG